MNIEYDIFDHLETTALEPHDDYTSNITYKDQKIIWNRLKELKQKCDFYHNKYIEEKTKNFKAREYINQLDKSEDKIDDYAISKYVRQELSNILESKGE